MIDKTTFPPSPPPPVEPQYCPALRHPEQETIYSLLNTYIYIWLKNGGSAWVYPVHFNDNLLYGYVWIDENWESIVLRHDYIDSVF